MHWVLVLFALFASLFTLSKTALNYSEPFFLIGSRMTFAGILLLGHQIIFNRDNFKIRNNHLIPLFLFGLVSIYVTNISEIWGLQFMSSSKACLIYSLSPFIAALFAYIILKERLTSKKWLGLAIGFIGILPILFTDGSFHELTQDLMIVTKGEIALLVAVFASVYGWIMLKRIITEFRYTPILANGIAMTIGGSFALLHSYLGGEQWNPIPIIGENNYTAFLEVALWMTLISNIVCYNLYGYLLKRFSATFMALAGLVTPLFASLFGWYFLNEIITWHYFAAMIVFSIGLFIFYQEELQANLQPSPSS